MRSYIADQWSPINTEGKKSYDRNFLLQMQYSNESLEKPEGLPKLPDVILDKVRASPLRMTSWQDIYQINLTRYVTEFSMTVGDFEMLSWSRYNQWTGSLKWS